MESRGGSARSLPGLAAACLLVACTSSGTPAQPHAGIVGVYGSVTESECNVRVDLRRSGEAIVRESCRSEVGSGRDVVLADTVRWAFADGEVRIEGVGPSARFLYRERLPYSGFGGEGAGPGLEPVGSPEERDRVDLHGYGTLWKHPHPEAGV